MQASSREVSVGSSRPAGRVRRRSRWPGSRSSTGSDSTRSPDRETSRSSSPLVALAVAAYGRDRVRDPRLHALSYLPLALLVAVTVGEWLLRASPAEVGFTAVGLAVLALAAVVYDGAGSLWLPAVVYATFTVTGQVTVVLESGAHA